MTTDAFGEQWTASHAVEAGDDYPVTDPNPI